MTICNFQVVFALAGIVIVFIMITTKRTLWKACFCFFYLVF